MNVSLPGSWARKFWLHILIICAFFLAFAVKAEFYSGKPGDEPRNNDRRDNDRRNPGRSITRSAVTYDTSGVSSQSAYLQPVATGVQFTPILTANDTVGSYRMSGIPDGLGAFDNGDGTFTLLANHELTIAMGVPRAHGSKGAFVSKWIINKSNLKVLSGSDLIKRVNLWNPATSTYTLYDSTTPSPLTIFGRFCSADLPAVNAFYNPATGLGTQERIFMNGEETNDESRGFAHIVTGPNGGTSWELPAFGKAAWENSVATPNSGDKTVVGEMNDGTDGQVYFYIGTKTNTGTEIEKAGLTNGHPFGVKVDGFSVERVNSTTINLPPAPGTRFSLVDIGDVRGITGAAFNTASNTAGITKFSRPEDGAWDPSHPNDFYFNTTDQIDQVNDGIGTQVGRSRVWRLRFDDIKHPENGGTAEAVIDGTEGINMLDNMTIDKNGHMLLCEDVGNSAHNGKVWQYNIATDSLKLIGKHDPARFGDIGVPATAPFNQDEESSGVLDVQEILGPGKFLITVQAHYTTGVPVDIAEGGQLLQIYDPYAINTPPTVTITSPANGSTINAGPPITVTAQAADPDGSIVKVAFYEGASKLGEDTLAPYQFTGTDVEPGTYTITAKAYDNSGDSAVSDTVRVIVAGCTGSGSISGEGFTDIPGSSLINLSSSVKYPNNPDVTAQLSSFEYGPNIGDNYGARMRGYLCAPATGNYTFYLTSDEQSELWLSTNDDPANIRRIAFVEKAVGFRAWLANSNSRSVPIHLVKGVRYYVETVHKEGTGNDHLSVGWQMPDHSFEGPIAGSRLSPYQTFASPQAATQDFSRAMTAAMSLHASVNDQPFTAIATPNPSSGQFTIAISSGSDAPVTLKMLDIAGRIVEVRTGLSPNGTVQIGANYRSGIYIAELVQGDKKVRLKLLKK